MTGNVRYSGTALELKTTDFVVERKSCAREDGLPFHSTAATSWFGLEKVALAAFILVFDVKGIYCIRLGGMGQYIYKDSDGVSILKRCSCYLKQTLESFEICTFFFVAPSKQPLNGFA